MKIFLIILAFCVLLSGCSGLLDGEYVWQASHPIEVTPGVGQDIRVSSYDQLYKALCDLVEAGVQQTTIIVEDYVQDRLAADVLQATQSVKSNDPIAAYAVEEIACDMGTSGSKTALSVRISYLHDRLEIRRIKRVKDNERAKEAVLSSLRSFDTGIVLLVEEYQEEDLVQLVETYSAEYPQYVMELPQVLVNLYPESGKARVVEMRFSYQTGRDSLKKMQSYVQTLFSSAMGYVSGDTAQGEKFHQLYGFLMTRYDDKLETAITPAYHLLYHGVGDSRAIATVYAAMCRQAGLECLVVSGTRGGEPWFWNIVCKDGVFYHVDLLRCHEAGEYQEHNDEMMQGYVWDYTAYPACGVQEIPEEPFPEDEKP